MNAKEFIRRMPEVVQKDKVDDTQAVIQYNISEPMYQVVRDGELTVHEGVAENPNLTITMKDDDLVKLFRGKLNPMMAFMTGKIKVAGDMKLAQKLVGFVDQSKISDLA
jgi:putative sterol carrier protein